MAKKISILFFLFYFFSGVAACFIGYFANKNVAEHKIMAAIQAKGNSAASNGEMLDRLPDLFHQFVHLRAMLAFNEKNQLFGRLHDSSRMTTLELNEFQSILTQNQRPWAAGFGKFTVDIPALGSKISAAYLKSVTAKELWFFYNEKYPYLKWLTLSYFILGVLLCLFAFLSSSLKPQLSMSPLISPVLKQNMPAEIMTIKAEKEKDSPPSLLYNNQLQGILEKIQSIFHCKSITYFTWEDESFVAVCQKFGGLIIKGDAIEQIPDAVYAVANPRSWSKILRSPDFSQLLVPVRRSQTTLGAFVIVFAEKDKISDEHINRSIGKLEQLADSFARTIFIQRTYEKAIIDEDTDFFTYPYFYFSLKERLISDSLFGVLIFEIKDLPGDKTLLRNWSRQVLNLLPRKTGGSSLEFQDKRQLENHLICRLDQNRFAALLQLNSRPSSNLQPMAENLDIESAMQFSDRLGQSLTNLHLPLKNIFGTLVIRPLELKNPEAFLKRVEFGLQKAIAAESYGTVFNAKNPVA